MKRSGRQPITMRHLGASDNPAPVTAKISGPEIKAIREQAKLGQAVLARFLNVTAGYVSQLERGEKTPIGPALVLFNVIRRKGIEAIL
jgi:putative transcriptional regulator